MSANPAENTSGARVVSLTRTFDAPPSAVWRAWTDPVRFADWFSTPPFRTPADRVSLDVRPGGAWNATQVGDDGTELAFVGHYREVDEPKRLVFTFENPQDPADPEVEIATMTLRDLGGRTELTFEQAGHLPPEQYVLMKVGYAGFFDRLAAQLARE